MQKKRIILHSDMNSFYASVETMLDPSLRGKAVAVCGSSEERHGIVLAKSETAKRAGVKTGMANWQAKLWCPSLIIVRPHYEQYLKYSKLTRAIYLRYTDLVEPYGMDESWLDVSGSTRIFGDGMAIAEEIRQSVKSELGLTVSIGVSFNKVFAKLGSDMKKPDAITEISESGFRQFIWPLPAAEMLYVGRATAAKLEGRGIYTIGQLASARPEMLKSLLGVNGLYLWSFANGEDGARVMHKDFVSPVKSIGHGVTCISDLHSEEEVWKVLLELSQDIGHKLRVHGLLARGVQISLRSSELCFRQYQSRLSVASRSPKLIAETARALFHAHYDWTLPIRTVTVRAIDLCAQAQPQQTDLFTDAARLEKQDRLEGAIDGIRSRFGKQAIKPASLMEEDKMPACAAHDLTMPGAMYM